MDNRGTSAPEHDQELLQVLCHPCHVLTAAWDAMVAQTQALLQRRKGAFTAGAGRSKF
jgi:hypothetical protein